MKRLQIVIAFLITISNIGAIWANIATGKPASPSEGISVSILAALYLWEVLSPTPEDE